MFRLVEMSGTCRSDSGAGVNKIGISESESQDEMKPKERKERPNNLWLTTWQDLRYLVLFVLCQRLH